MVIFNLVKKKDDHTDSLTDTVIKKVLVFSNTQNEKGLRDFLKTLHFADIADVFEQVSKFERKKILNLINYDLKAEVFNELTDHVLDEIINIIPETNLSFLINSLEIDDLVNIYGKISDLNKKKLLNSIDESKKNFFYRALKYDIDTAGRFMQVQVVTANEDWNVGNAIDFLRSSVSLPTNFYEIIIVNEFMNPVGIVSLSRLMSSRREILLNSLMKPDFKIINDNQSKEDVAYIFNQYHIVSAPVVDSNKCLVGTITIDDAIDISEEATEEDMKKLGGIGDEELSDSVVGIALARLPWLFANLITAIIASIVIAQFTETINSIVALAVLMPIVASMGGNAGTQTLTVAVRALATRDLTNANATRVIFREISVGVANGFIFAIIVGFITFYWYQNYDLAIIIGLALICNMFMASLSGILLPIGLKKLGADPALSSSVFVTTVTDVIGFLSFLWFATFFLI